MWGNSQWIPLCAGLTAVGLIASWFAWRRRGAAAGLRGAAWSLLPAAAYLTGAVDMLWKMGAAVTTFATGFVFSPKVWSGIIVVGVSAVLFTVTGGLRRGRARKKVGDAGPGGTPAAAAGAAPGKALKPAKSKAAPPADDELGDVADILRRRGIH